MRPEEPNRALTGTATPSVDTNAVDTALVDLVLGDGFPCVAARSAFNRGDYRFGVHGTMGNAASAEAVCGDLYAFARGFSGSDDRFRTFIAVFEAQPVLDEMHFETLLWRHLQAMHAVDAERFGWAAGTSSDPDDDRFAFSIGGRAWFVVGMHPKASRRARRAPWPMLVFNSQAQFERLREKGRFESMRRAIRARDLAYQGSINPMLSDFGSRPESRQYAGRHVPEDWKCPFRALHSPKSIQENAHGA